MKRSGGCHCGAIRYEISKPIEIVANCHCRNCRRANGGPFSAVALVKTADFDITRGEADIREFVSGPGVRTFCGTCGGRLFSRGVSDTEFTNLLISTLDEEPDTPPMMHFNVESKAPWYEILDERPQFPALPGESRES